MLSCGGMCACDILNYFNFTQPTLSHHMKVLEDNGLVIVDKKANWHYYSLNRAAADFLISNLTLLVQVQWDYGLVFYYKKQVMKLILLKDGYHITIRCKNKEAFM